MSNFERKAYSREEINIIVAEQLKLCIEPICREIGQAIEGTIKRLAEAETTLNALIVEMKEWKAKNQITLQ